MLLTVQNEVCDENLVRSLILWLKSLFYQMSAAILPMIILVGNGEVNDGGVVVDGDGEVITDGDR